MVSPAVDDTSVGAGGLTDLSAGFVDCAAGRVGHGGLAIMFAPVAIVDVLAIGGGAEHEASLPSSVSAESVGSCKPLATQGEESDARSGLEGGHGE